MAIVNYKCPNCSAPLKFNPEKQLFSCEYCGGDFSEQQIQQLYAKQEEHISEEEKRAQNVEEKQKEQEEKQKDNSDENNFEEEAVVFTCPSCGAEVVTTNTTSATTCFYCQNPVVLGGRLSGDFKPDKIIPFSLTKENAIDKFLEMCKKKWFLPKAFASKKQFDKFTGVYFPYWYIDEQKNSSMVAKGNKVRVWRTGKKEYTETSVYRLERTGNVIINNVFERALKSEDRDMLQSVHPYDLSKAKDFAMSYLSGFQAEKRDLEQADVNDIVQKRMSEYSKELLKDTMKNYSGVVIQSYNDVTELESWRYMLLPVWITTYKYNGKIYPFAINGQTGKAYGTLPTDKRKLAIAGVIIALLIFILGTLGGYLFL